MSEGGKIREASLKLVLARRPMGSQGISCSKGPEKADSNLLYTGQVDKNIETETEIQTTVSCCSVPSLFEQTRFSKVYFVNKYYTGNAISVLTFSS